MGPIPAQIATATTFQAEPMAKRWLRTKLLRRNGVILLYREKMKQIDISCHEAF